MPIREKGYHRWDGELKQGGVKWLPIFFTGIKAVKKKKWSRLLFGFSISPFLFFLAFAYAMAKPELKMFEQAKK